MGLFDFLKRRDDPAKPLEKILGSQGAAQILLMTELNQLEKQAANMRALGRHTDALKLASTFLEKLLRECRKDPSNPWPFQMTADAAIRLEALEMGKRGLETTIQLLEAKPLMPGLPDLTMIYFSLGQVYHYIRSEPEKELRCYRKAGEAKAPPGCKYPASRIDKALVHHFGFMCADRLGQEKQAKLHDAKRRELAPTVDWENDNHIDSFVRDRKEPPADAPRRKRESVPSARKAHYAFAYSFLPNLAFDNPDGVVSSFTKVSIGSAVLRVAYNKCAEVFPESERTPADDLQIEQFRPQPDIVMTVITMPPPERRTEAYFVGFILPLAKAGSVAAEKVRVFVAAKMFYSGKEENAVLEIYRDGSMTTKTTGQWATVAEFVSVLKKCHEGGFSPQPLI